MGRKPRLFYSGALVHVFSRGNNLQTVFREDSDYNVFLTYLIRIKKLKSFLLHAYCLMPNHFHLLISVKEISVSIVMQRLLTQYVLYFNRKYKHVGHLFQGRYKAILCEKESYFLELVRYIHLNPVRAGLVKSPQEWRWSGHRFYLGSQAEPRLDDSDTLSYFSTNKSPRQAYSEFVRDGIIGGGKGNLYPPENIPFLGSDKFVEELTMRHKKIVESRFKDIGIKPVRKSLDSVLQEVAIKYQISEQLIQSTSKLPVAVRARRTFINTAYDGGYKTSEIANFIGCSLAVVSRRISSFDNVHSRS